MKKMKQHLLSGMLILTALISGNAAASTYVSFKGKFYIEYPDDWLQVPYLTADVFLKKSGSDPSSLNYDAVFAPKSSSPFFANDYLMLTVDTLEWLYDFQIDSVVDEMSKTFGKEVQYFPSWDKPANLQSNTPVYDKKNKIITVINDIVAGGKVVKKNLMVKKFHDKGIANFYFYAPDSTFEKSKTIFQGIVNSFSTENVSQAIPKEAGKVSDPADRDKLNFRQMLIPIGAAFIILLILLARLRKAKKRKQS